LEACRRAAEFTKARCVSRIPQLPDTSTGVLRTLDWSPRELIGDSEPIFKGPDFGPVYLVVRQSPPNRHVITMASMKKCLEAAAFTSAKCVEELPRLPDTSRGVLRTLNETDY